MKKTHLITENLSSRVAESYRVLRTNLQFTSLEKPLRTLLVSSTAPAEGKTTTATNLAIAFAQSGSKVLIIDGDLRRPSLHKHFRISNPLGLVNLLVQNVAIEVALREVGVPNLQVITAGPIPPNPAEVLGSSRMRALLATLAKSFDLVIVDSPPVLAVADATILASIVDGVLLVISSAEVSVEKAKKAKAQLEGVKANLIGVVLNGFEHDSDDDYYYYYYGARVSGKDK